MTFTILSVCTGNICRSPIAEAILADGLSPLRGVVVHSAGTGALVGHSVPEPAQRLANTIGLNTTTHRARQIEMTMIREADLVVAMSREHRRFIVEQVPAAMRRAFTLRELARIADVLEPELISAISGSGATTEEDGMRAAISRASSLRGTVPPPSSPEEFDIVDPYRQSDRVLRPVVRGTRPGGGAGVEVPDRGGENCCARLTSHTYGRASSARGSHVGRTGLSFLHRRPHSNTRRPVCSEHSGQCKLYSPTDRRIGLPD